MEDTINGGRRRFKARQTELPRPQSGWFDVSYAVEWDGTMSVMRATHDVRSGWARRNAIMATIHSHVDHTPEKMAEMQRVSAIPDGTQARLVRFGRDGIVADSGAFPLEDPFPKFASLPDRHWIIASARCAPGALNGGLLDQDGRLLGRVAVGDGVNHLQSDPHGRIWAGYFDEGLYSGDPLSQNGLCLFDRAGRAAWSYPQAEGQIIDDCYALNCSADDTWCCPYGDFPIIRIRDGEVRLWRNDIAGARALAVDWPCAALLGRYNAAGEIALLRFDEDAAKPVATFVLDIGGDELRLAYCFGRGDALHVIAGDAWHSISVGELRRSAGA